MRDDRPILALAFVDKGESGVDHGRAVKVAHNEAIDSGMDGHVSHHANGAVEESALRTAEQKLVEIIRYFRFGSPGRARQCRHQNGIGSVKRGDPVRIAANQRLGPIVEKSFEIRVANQGLRGHSILPRRGGRPRLAPILAAFQP